MRNVRNNGTVTGRLAKGPVIQTNKDGSRKIRITLAVLDNYVDSEGSRGTQFIPLEAFIPSKHKGNGAYDYLDCGDLVSCSYSIRNNNYENKKGETVYGIVLLIDDIAMLESKASKEARQAAKATA